MVEHPLVDGSALTYKQRTLTEFSGERKREKEKQGWIEERTRIWEIDVERVFQEPREESGE